MFSVENVLGSEDQAAWGFLVHGSAALGSNVNQELCALSECSLIYLLHIGAFRITNTVDGQNPALPIIRNIP